MGSNTPPRGSTTDAPTEQFRKPTGADAPTQQFAKVGDDRARASTGDDPTEVIDTGNATTVVLPTASKRDDHIRALVPGMDDNRHETGRSVYGPERRSIPMDYSEEYASWPVEEQAAMRTRLNNALRTLKYKRSVLRLNSGVLTLLTLLVVVAQCVLAVFVAQAMVRLSLGLGILLGMAALLMLALKVLPDFTLSGELPEDLRSVGSNINKASQPEPPQPDLVDLARQVADLGGDAIDDQRSLRHALIAFGLSLALMIMGGFVALLT